MNTPKVVQVEWRPLSELKRHPRARIHSPEELEKLKYSMKTLEDQLQPVRARWKDGGLEIYVGAGRYQAATELEWECLMVMILERTDEQVDLEMLHENLKREDLDPLTEAKEYRYMMDTYHWNQVQMAEKAGVSQEEISRSLSLLNLAVEVQEIIRRRIISKSHGNLISKLTDQGLQNEAAQRVIQGQLNVDQTDEMVSHLLAGRKPPMEAEKQETAKRGAPKAASNMVNLADLWPNLPTGVLAKVEKGWVTLRWSPAQYPDIRPVLDALVKSVPESLVVPVSRRAAKRTSQNPPESPFAKGGEQKQQELDATPLPLAKGGGEGFTEGKATTEVSQTTASDADSAAQLQAATEDAKTLAKIGGLS